MTSNIESSSLTVVVFPCTHMYDRARHQRKQTTVSTASHARLLSVTLYLLLCVTPVCVYSLTDPFYHFDSLSNFLWYRITPKTKRSGVSCCTCFRRVTSSLPSRRLFHFTRCTYNSCRNIQHHREHELGAVGSSRRRTDQ